VGRDEIVLVWMCDGRDGTLNMGELDITIIGGDPGKAVEPLDEVVEISGLVIRDEGMILRLDSNTTNGSSMSPYRGRTSVKLVEIEAVAPLISGEQRPPGV
jgi:hypothetical protein